MPCPVESRACFFFRACGITINACIVFSYCALMFREHIDAEPFLRVKMRVRAGCLVHANQHQHRIQRYRSERICGHALDLILIVDGYDRDAGSEVRHRLAEVVLGEAHAFLSCTTSAAFSSPEGFQYDFVLYDAGGRQPVGMQSTIAHVIATRDELAPSTCADLVPPITRGAACRWITATDADMPRLLSAAREARDKFKPGVITYSRKVFIPLTNLCRDYCGYCTFRRDPGQAGAHTMTPDEVLAVARAGEKLGCTEALFSLGDKPELIFPEMRESLRRLGFKSTLHYLEAMCELVLRETSLLPHPNPGLMSAEWISRLAQVSPSMGLMLETTNAGLLATGAAHDNAPDKLPEKRVRVIEEAGKQGVPFTTGILIGIGESVEDRVDALVAIRDLHDRYGHVQEVIIQNFRVKPEIPMSNWPEPSRGEMMSTIAIARLLMPDVNIQAPPNLSDPDYEELLDAGINDWGGISPLTPDFINPERPWPHLEDLEARTRAKGFELVQRLPVYPEFLSGVLSRPGLLSSKLSEVTDTRGYARSAA